MLRADERRTDPLIHQFCGAGGAATFCWSRSQRFFKNQLFVAIYLKEAFDDNFWVLKT
jgi:hypothetical protein